jgi:hypothetical protein
MPPAFFFVIDVSHAAVASGVLAHVCRAIRASLDRLPGGERTRIGFLTFDTALHFYNLKAGLTQPQMMARLPPARPAPDPIPRAHAEDTVHAHTLRAAHAARSVRSALVWRADPCSAVG